jgi:hypothetical protein
MRAFYNSRIAKGEKTVNLSNLARLLRKPKTTLAECALAYAEAGFAIFPLLPRDKKPLISKRSGGRGYKDASCDVEQVKTWWERYPNANIGCVPGRSRLLVIDIDGPDGEKTWATLGLAGADTLTVVTGRTNGGRHLYFEHPGGVLNNSPLGNKLDVRADGGYVVLPPSIHPSGKVYRWVDPKRRIAVLPPTLKDLLTDKVGEGNRNNRLLSHLGVLRRAGAEEHELTEAANRFNLESLSPPLEQKEVRSVVRSILRYPPVADSLIDKMVSELNEEYAVVKIGDKVRVLELTSPDLVLLRREEFRFFLSNQYVSNGETRIPVVDIWLKSPARRQFSSVVFEPGATDTGNAWNLWRGWSVEARAGDCSLFFDHVRENICGGEEELFRWVIAWFADLFQNPREKPGTALVLVGKQGTGKTIVGKIIGQLLGNSYKMVASAHQVTGQFNAHMSDCLLLQAEEAFWAGDKVGESVLKHLITSDVHRIERKGIDSIQVRNFVRLLVTSNSDWSVPAGLEERRFCVIEVGDSRIQDKRYFGDLLRQMDTGGFEALLDHLLRVDCKGVDLRTTPQTGALFRQKIATLTAEASWWLDILVNGFLPGDREGMGEVPRYCIFDSFISHGQKTGRRRRGSETAIGMFLQKHVPGLRRDLAQYGEDTVPSYVFPALEDCRSYFAKLAHYEIEWAQPSEWISDPHFARNRDDDSHQEFG